MHETSSSEAMAASSPPIQEEEEDSEADDAIVLDGGADFVRLAPQSDAEEEGVAHWAFCVQWDKEMRAGATIKVPATEGLSKEELTIDLDKDVADPSKRPPGSRGTTVQFTVALPLLPDGASFFTVEGVKLLPAPEEAGKVLALCVKRLAGRARPCAHRLDLRAEPVPPAADVHAVLAS